MTVDENSFASFCKLNPQKASEYLGKLRDVTGVKAEDVLRKALDESRESSGSFDLNKAIKLINGFKSEQAEERVALDDLDDMPPVPAVAINSTLPQRPIVDLTEDKDDLQRAIALSLAENGIQTSTGSSSAARPPGVTQEDQDVSKALEASLMESVSNRRSVDGVNPNDRKRDCDWPVGLKNVGQTCWFSAVIQSFFHLPAFRVLVLNFKPPQQEPKSERERKILDFMLELRKLFSLLVGSQRKYVDPNRAVGILRGYLGGQSNYCNNQQDVSEFTHKLLDWLEEAFKIRDKVTTTNSPKQVDQMESDTEKCDKEKDVEKTEDDDDKTAESCGESGSRNNNPMYDLFYGKVRIEGKNQGIEFSRVEQFGQWPLQVNNFSDIHDSLEASTAHEFIDCSSQSDLPGLSGQLGVRKSGQERWFTLLPPVLFFELSRFQYNQQRKMAEKINNFLDFPYVIYMDRYLEVNKSITRAKREEVKALKIEREKLKSRLLAFMEYGADTSHAMPLVNILTRTMQFARSATVSQSAAGGGDETVTTVGGATGGVRDVDTCSPGGSSNAMQVDSPCPSPVSLTPASSMVNLDSCGDKEERSPLKTFPDGSVQIPIKVEGVDPSAPTPMEVESCASDSGNAKLAIASSTKATASEKLATASDSAGFVPVPKHVSEVELKVLSTCLTRWKQEIEDDLSALNEALEEVETKIAKMYDTPSLNKTEYKLHAVMVHEGDVNQGHYWAYVYHPARKVWLKFNDNTVSDTTWSAMKKESAGGRLNTSAYSMVYIDTSRPDLIRAADGLQVSSDAGTREMLPDDLEMYVQEDNKCFAAEILHWNEQLTKKTTSGEIDMNEGVLIGDDPECQIIESKNNLTNSHAVLAEAVTNRAINSAATANHISEKMINQMLVELYDKAIDKCKEGDYKLESFLHYLLSVDGTQEMSRRALWEQFTLPSLDTSTDFRLQVVLQAREQLKTCKVSQQQMVVWHKNYHNFRTASYYFVIGVDRYHENKFEDSVELLTTSYIVNEKLLEETTSCKFPAQKAMWKPGLIKYFHIAVEYLNSHLVDEFQRGNNPAEVEARVGRTLVPAIHILQERTNVSRDSCNRDANLLETVRGRWCALLESPMPPEKHECWTSVFNKVVSDEGSVIRQPPNLRYPNLEEDLKLAARYRSIMQTVLKEES